MNSIKKMKIAFLTEMNFTGKIPETYENMRTEFAWMNALDATHHPISDVLNNTIINYDHVFIVFPKGRTYLNSEGSRLSDKLNPASDLLKSNFIDVLKESNKKVHFVQEGPHWFYTDYEVLDQILFYTMISKCDTIFAHNESDINYYKGLFPDNRVEVIRSLMGEYLIQDIQPQPEDKVIIGGNFARWYGGFESYIVAAEFGTPIWVQDSHAKREQEEQIDNLNHFPRMMWDDWMKKISTFKYAVHLMPTAAAGTFSLNCAYFGIPCIGNNKVDTQRICHPDLSVDVGDVLTARVLAKQLKEDVSFYEHCSGVSKLMYKEYYTIEKYKNNLERIL